MLRVRLFIFIFLIFSLFVFKFLDIEVAVLGSCDLKLDLFGFKVRMFFLGIVFKIGLDV